jgi:hypothetical protein
VPITRVRPVIRTQPLIPNTLGELGMMQVMPPIAMTALTAGSEASLNLISMGGALGGGGGGLKIRSVLLIY